MIETLRRLAVDTRGDVNTFTLQFGLTWFVTTLVFLMNVMLGQLFYRRDAVDHSAAVAADVAKKTYCMKEENAGATEAAANKAIRNVLDTVDDKAECKLSITPAGSGSDPGSKKLDVVLACTFACEIPIASEFMCNEGKVTFDTKIETVSMGCDGRGG